MPRCWFIKAAANNELPQCCIPQLWSAFFLKSTRWQRGNLDPTLCQKTHTASESIFSTQHQSEAGPHSTTGHPLVEIKCGACTDVVLLPLMLFYSLYNSRSQIVVKWGRKRRREKKKRVLEREGAHSPGLSGCVDAPLPDVMPSAGWRSGCLSWHCPLRRKQERSKHIQ